MAAEKNIEVHKLIDSDSRDNKQRFIVLFFMSLSVLFFFRSSMYAQDRLEVGPLAGVSYYMGDLNPGVPFVKPRPALGGLLRYVFNDRIALKGTAIFAGLSGSYDSDKDGILPTYGWVNGTPASFSRNVINLSLSGEINLFSYDHKYISTTVFTPYISLGFGGMGYNRLVEISPGNTDTKPYFVLSLPLGLGVKYKFSKWLRVGAEWSFVKLFVDDVDNYDALGDTFHNNDWFSVINIYVTFGFLKRNSECWGGL